MLNTKKVGLIALFATMTVSGVFAGTLTSFTTGDVLISFRKSGGANDMVVDAGPVSGFTNLAPNTRITISQYTTNQLYLIGLNSVIFSAYTWFSSGNESGDNQLFMSRGRSSLNTQTQPWAQIPNITASANYFCGNDMGSIVNGAVNCRSYFGGSTNTDSAILEPDDSAGYNTSQQNPAYTSGLSYGWAMNGTGSANFNGDFGAGSPEKTAPSTFVTGSTVVRSDFYFVPAQGFGSVKFMGYFELNTNGILSYVAFPSGVPTVPVIRSIGRTNGVTSVNFSTGTSGTYTLRGTNGVSGFRTARTNWPAISSVTGNGGNNTLQDTTTATNKFYLITAQ